LVKVSDTQYEGREGGGSGTLAFTVSINGTSGAVTVTQNATLEHTTDGSTPAAHDDSLSLSGAAAISVIQKVIDGDGDSDTATSANALSISFKDDGPSAFVPDSTHIVDMSLATHTATNPLNFAGHTGADGLGTVTFNIANDGVPATDAHNNPLTLNGAPLYLHYGSGGTDHTQLVATTSTGTGGTVGFAFDIDPAGNTYTLSTTGIIRSTPEVIEVTNLSSVGGGNVAYKGLIDVGGTLNDVLISTNEATSVNTSSKTIGVGSGESFTNGDVARFDFLNDLTTVLPSVNPTGFTYSSHDLTAYYKQSVTGLGGPQIANLKVTAILADNDSIFVGDSDGESIVNLDEGNIKVWNGAVDVTGSVTLTDNLDGSVTINGMENGWSFEISSLTQFSALQVEGASGTNTFKLGAFTYSATSPAAPVDLSFAITGFDADGDSVASAINATLYPSAQSIEGTAGNDATLTTGTQGTDYIFGYDGDDTLSGLGGNDVLVGGAGNDILFGGAGTDKLVGGVGNDTFVFKAVADAGDTITDFTAGDKLNLADLFTSVGVTDTTGVNLANYLSVSTASGDTVVKFDPTGAANFGAAATLVTLQGAAATITDLNSLLANTDTTTHLI